MTPVDPAVLLNTIVYLLDNNGGLKNDRVIRQFITLMKLAEKLVNKAIYLQILSHTKSEEILRTFLKSDGHQILIKWLSHFSTEHNHAFLLDTLNVLGDLPIHIDNVSQNDIDELQLKIAELASAESGEEKDIRESARHLYDIWSTKGVFKTINPPTPQFDIDERTFSQPSSTSRSSIFVDKHPLISQRLNQNERTLFSSNNNNNNSSDFNDRKMATTATLTAVSPAGTTSSNSSTDNNKRKSEENIGPTTNRKPTNRRVSNQLQTDSTKMKTSIDIDDSDGFNKTNSLNRTTPTFRIPKLGRPNSSVPSPPSEITESLLSTNQQTKSGVQLNRQTSDELNSQQGKRKFSLSQYKEHKRLKSNEVQNSLADTDMRINNMGNSKASPPMTIDDDSPNIPDNQPIVSPKSDETSKDTVIKSNLSEPGVKKVVKKKVIWADEKSQTLVQTSYFEVDDSELSDMHVFARTCAANISIAQLEKVMERDLRKRRGVQDMNSNDNDDKQYTTPLPTLIKILLPDAIQIPQIISQERFVQEEREKTVLQALFIRSFLPDSPGEPDGDLVGNNNIERSEPKLIPLEDDTSSSVSSKVTSVNSNNPTTITTTNIPLVSTNNSIPTTTTTTTTSTVTPSLSSLSFTGVSPEVAQILAQAKGNLTSATANNISTTTATNTLINPSTTLTTATSTITNPTIISTPNLPAPPDFLAALLNVRRTTGNEPSNVPPPNSIANLLPNLPLNFNLPPPPTPFPLSQLIANALTLGIPPPPTATPSLYQTPPPATFTAPPPNMSNPIVNSVPPVSINSKPPSVRFVSAIGQQTRPNLTNNNEHQISSSRENSREHNFRRGPPNNNRRDYYQNRNNHNNNNNNNSNNNNNNNRNIFS